MSVRAWCRGEWVRGLGVKVSGCEGFGRDRKCVCVVCCVSKNTQSFVLITHEIICIIILCHKYFKTN